MVALALVAVVLALAAGVVTAVAFLIRLVRWSRRRLASSPLPSPGPMIKRLFAVAFIFACCSIAWMILGGTVVHRTETSGASTWSDVGELWGGPQVQRAPTVARLGERTRTVTRQEPTGNPNGSTRPVAETVTETTRTPVPLAATDVAADLRLDHRKKGLMWYATYAADVDGRYRVENDGEAGRFEFAFPLPTGSSVFSDLALEVDGRSVEVDAEGGEIRHVLDLKAGEAAEVRVRYGSQGVETWRYAFASDTRTPEIVIDEYGESRPLASAGGVRTARDVRIAVTTDFSEVDFPGGTLSPTGKERTDAGWRLLWDHGTLVASADVGVEMPQRLNPGPWVSRVTFFAPVSLFLFFFAVFVLSVLRGVRLHPMHYFFLGAACFAFHLLLAYLVDVVSVGAAMTIASVVSVGLVVSYVRLVAGLRFALVEVGGAQLVYLVAFAGTFFLDGVTGLAVTLLSVATLFVVMQATGRLDWEAVLARPDGDLDAARRERPAVAA
ncbi:inner membrane CreD family protein [Rubrivirga sp.]|uniref:inner membrane CreD family protein n=1 Tax=Rubrivirga sp. TaxID=1885344 RepID=UPI003B52ED62